MLNWGILLSTFVVVFFAELGDKTQLVAFSMTSTSRHPLLIFIATSLALSCSAVLAALLGGFTANLIPSFTTYLSAALFLCFGGYILLAKEPPRIKECFLKALSLENTLLHILPRLMQKMDKYDSRIRNLLHEEKAHSGVFRLLLKEKRLFKDDINTADQLETFTGSLDLKQNLLKLPPGDAVARVIAWEEAGRDVFQFILEHLDTETHHNDTEFRAVLQTLVDEEEQHINLFKTIREELSADGQ